MINQEFLKKIAKLPLPNSSLQKVMETINQKNCDWKRISPLILQDPILTGRVLQIANSSFYGAPRQVLDIEIACSMLGIVTLSNLVHTLILMGQFRHGPQKSMIDYDALWSYSLSVACLTKIKAAQTRIDSNLAFTTALFHCMDLILQDFLDQQALENRIAMALQNSKLQISVPLDKKIDTNGFDLIAMLLEHWHFPLSVIAVFNNSEDTTSVAIRKLIISSSDVINNQRSNNENTEQITDSDVAKSQTLYKELQSLIAA
jgi:HD-like signal output (HDOD) protein